MLSWRKLLLFVGVLLIATLPPPRAYARGNKNTEVIGLPTPFNLIIGRFPRHIAEYVPVSAPPAPPPAGSYEELAWRIRFGGSADDAAAYVALADWHAAHGEDELAWWASMRAIELGTPAASALGARCAEIETRWRAAGRHDPPTAEQYHFVRGGADRWVKAFQIAERQAFHDGERPGDEAVQRRIGEQADMQVPPALLGADSFMRRWGVGLLIAGVASVFWAIYLVAILRKRRRPAARAR